MILLQLSDFTGFYILNVNTANTPILQALIDRYEAYYIKKLLGVELGLAFIADLQNISQDARFSVLQDPFDLHLAGTTGQYNPITGKKTQTDYSSRGMIDFLAACVFYEWAKTRQVRATDNGIAVSVDEAETLVTPKEAANYGESKWNEAVETAEAIQWYCTTYAPATYPTTPARLYPEYNGDKFDYLYNQIF